MRKEYAPETYEHLGEELGRTHVGDMVLRADEFGDRLEIQGEVGAQKALEQARDPDGESPDFIEQIKFW